MMLRLTILQLTHLPLIPLNPSILRWYTTMTMQISKLPQLTARKFPTM